MSASIDERPVQPSGPTEATRVAVLSGGSRGVGRAIALRLAQQGMTIVLLHSPGGRASAEEALGLLRPFSPAAAAYSADVADEAQVTSAFDQIVDDFGRVDVLINAAGHLQLTPLVDLELEELDRNHRTLVRGVFAMCRQAARVMGPGGSIINMSSVAVGLDVPGSGVYVSGKAAVEALTPILAAELAQRQISVNTVSIGLTEAEAELLASVSRVQSDWGHELDDPDDIAAVVAYLAGPDGHWMSGHVVPASRRPA